MKKHIPNALTLVRIGLIAPLLALYLSDPASVIPVILFFFIAITDALDGFLARRWNVTSAFGAFLDPAADKLLIISVLFVLTTEQHTWLFTLPALLIVCREMSMSMVREWTARQGLHEVTAVDNWGKVKTVMQMVALGLFLTPIDGSDWYAYICLYVAAGLTLTSFVRYFRQCVLAIHRPKLIKPLKVNTSYQ